MSDQQRKGTLPSMQAVGGKSSGNGHHDESPATEWEPRSEMQTPAEGTPLDILSAEAFLNLPQEDKNALIHGEFAANRRAITRQEAAHAELKRAFDHLGGKVDAALTDARADRISHANDRKEWRAELTAQKQTLAQFDAHLARMSLTIAARVTKDVTAAIEKQIDNLTTVFTSKVDGLKRSDSETKQSLARAHGRIGLHDDRLDKIEMHENVQDARLRGVEADIGEVPHKLDPRGSLQDQTPEQVKQREENAAKGTGIRGDIARIDNNVSALSGRRLAVAGAVLMTPGVLMEIGKTWGPEWAIGIASVVTLAGASVARVKKARAWLAAWWAGKRIKVTEKKP